MELAGLVDAVGEGTSWRPGDRVMAIVNPRRPGGGAQAELGAAVDLVLHEGDERGDDQGGAPEDAGRQLEGEGLSRAGGPCDDDQDFDE
jgi:hypothetical protein